VMCHGRTRSLGQRGGSSECRRPVGPPCNLATGASFAWQEGYGAFSVSPSNVPQVAAYIAKQAEHHRKMTFEDEFIALLKRHGIEYDPRYVWG